MVWEQIHILCICSQIPFVVSSDLIDLYLILCNRTLTIVLEDNLRTVMTLVNVLEYVLYRFDRNANFNIYMAIVFLCEIWLVWHKPPIIYNIVIYYYMICIVTVA